MASGGGSQHPTAQLIRELLDQRRDVTRTEREQIIAHIATAPFDQRIRPVPVEHRGVRYRGIVLGARADALIYHLVQRVAIDRQWADGVTATDYLDDLLHAVLAPHVELVLYQQRGGAIATILTPTESVLPPERRGTESLPLMVVIYSVDRDILITGYQVSSRTTVRIPGDALWSR